MFQFSLNRIIPNPNLGKSVKLVCRGANIATEKKIQSVDKLLLTN